MAIDGRLENHELFELITGRKLYGGDFPGDVPEFDIHPEKIDQIYLAVKKFQRCYHKPSERGTAKYYAPCFEQVEDAYLSEDFGAFKEAVRFLAISIDFEM